jgi:MoxR-like ATPase
MNDAPRYQSFLLWNNEPSAAGTALGPDDRSGAVYLHEPTLQLAAETAIVTQRPLLIRGEPGSGKSSFAPFAARNLGWRYYEMTVTGRTEARDLLWHWPMCWQRADIPMLTPNS